MRTKQNKDFTEIIEDLTELSEKDFREAIKIAKQFRKAQKSLQRAIVRQERERMHAKATPTQATIAGVDYELA